MEELPRVQREKAGCGVQGCLFGAVALFVLLLVGMLVLAVIRFGDRPSSEEVGPRVSGGAPCVAPAACPAPDRAPGGAA